MIEIMELAPAKPGGQGFVSLFNGKDTTGWKEHPKQRGGWTVESGLLVGRSATAHYLFTEQGDFENFDLITEARLQDNGKSGVFFRCGFGLHLGGASPKGYEAQMLNTFPQPKQPRTGSLVGLVNIDEQLVLPGEWFKMEVIAEGRHIVIKVNNHTTVDYVDEMNTYKKGHLAVQAMGPPATVVRFRKIEVKKLPPN